MRVEPRTAKPPTLTEINSCSSSSFDVHGVAQSVTLPATDIRPLGVQQGEHDERHPSKGNPAAHAAGHHEKLPSIVTAMASALINYLLMFGLCCAYGMIMFHDFHNRRHRAWAVKMNLSTAMLFGFVLAGCSKVPVAIGGPDLNPVVLLSGIIDTIAQGIAEQQDLTYPHEDHRRLAASNHADQLEFCEGTHYEEHTDSCENYHAELRATVIFTVSLSSAAIGLTFFCLGHFRLTRYVQYVPASVTEAFLSCVGYKVFKYAIKFCDVKAVQFLPAACIGVPLYLVKASHVGNPAIILPLGLLVPLALFYAGVYLADTDFDPVSNTKLMFTEMPNIEFWKVWEYSLGHNDKINYSAVSKAFPEFIIMIIVVVLDCVLKINSTESKLPVQVAKDYEIQLYGVGNALTMASGSTVGYMQLKFNVINYGVMGNCTDRRGGLCYAVLCGASYFGTIYHFNYLPRFFLSTLLFFAGAGFVAENLWGSRKYLTLSEWFEIIAILFVFIFTESLLYAVIFGGLLCGISFVRKYARIPAIAYLPSNGREINTKFRRNPLVQRNIDKITARWLVVLRLKGFVFFGSASSVTSYVALHIEREKLEDLPQQMRLRFVVLDCELLDGLDASACKAFGKMVRDARKEGVSIFWTNLRDELHEQLREREMLREEEGVDWFRTLHQAMAHVEYFALQYRSELQHKLLRLHPSFAQVQELTRAVVAHEPFSLIFKSDAARSGCPWRFCNVTRLEGGRTVLWEPGENYKYLFLVHSGAVGLFDSMPLALDIAEWAPLVIYRQGWFLNRRALSMSRSHRWGIAMEDGEVLSWSPEAWRAMGRECPVMMQDMMRAVLKQQSQDEHFANRAFEREGHDMDELAWEEFTAHVEVAWHTPASETVLDWIKAHTPTPKRQQTSRVTAVDYMTPMFSYGSTPSVLSPTTSLPEFYAAHALENLGYFTNSGVDVTLPTLPERIRHDLSLAFRTYAEETTSNEIALPHCLLRHALQYAGTFEELAGQGSGRLITEDEFIEIGRSLWFSPLSAEQADVTRSMFTKYDKDDNELLDIHELSTVFREHLHPQISVDEVEGIGSLWACNGLIDRDDFVAIMARFVRKIEPTWKLLCGIRELVQKKAVRELRLTPDRLAEVAHLSLEESKELIWGCSLGYSSDTDVNNLFLDARGLLTACTIILDNPQRKLPPSPSAPLDRTVKLVNSMKVTPKSVESSRNALSLSLVEQVATSHYSEQPESIPNEIPMTRRAKLHLLLEAPNSSREATYVSVVTFILICLSVISLVLEPLVSGSDRETVTETEKNTWNTLEIIFTVYFSIELLLRAAVADAIGTQTLVQFLRNPSTLCDLFAILGYFMELLTREASQHLKLLRTFRLARLTRIIRIARIGRIARLGSQVAIAPPVAMILVVIWGIYLKLDASKGDV